MIKAAVCRPFPIASLSQTPGDSELLPASPCESILIGLTHSVSSENILQSAKMLHPSFILLLLCALQANAVPAIVPVASSSDSISLLRPVDSTEPDALLKFVVAELERSKREAGTLGGCEGIEVAHIMRKHHKVENGIKYEMNLKMKPVHIVTDRCNNKAVKDVIPSTLEDCQIEVWEGVTVTGEMHPMALLRSSCKIQRD